MTELTESQRKLSALLPDVELRFEEALAKHTSFRIGGNAEVMAFPKTKEELADILKACAELNHKCARPFSRSQSTAASISPSVAWRAFLQSIMPTLVISRSFLTSSAVKAIFVSS